MRLDPLPGVTDFEKGGLPRVFDNHLDITTRLHPRGDPKSPDTNRVMRAGVPTVLSEFAPEIQPVKLPAYAFAPAGREYVQRDRLASAKAAVGTAKRELDKAKQLIANAPPEKPKPQIEPKPKII